jgi:hypothetical protein
LFSWDALSASNLLPAVGNRRFEAASILGIELVIVVLLDELETHLGAFGEVDRVLDDDSSALNATV